MFTTKYTEHVLRMGAHRAAERAVSPGEKL